MGEYQFARMKKRILKTSEVQPPRIDDIELREEFVRFEVPAQEEWLGEHDRLRDAPPGEARSIVVDPLITVVSWYERLVEEVLDGQHLHVDILDTDGEAVLEMRCKFEWAEEYLYEERTEASMVKLFSQTLGATGSNEEYETKTSPWWDVDEGAPKDLTVQDLP